MIIKISGALLIILGCYSIGYTLSSLHKHTTQSLHNLIDALEYMEYYLQYRQSSWQEMLHNLNINNGPIQKFFNLFAAELENQVSPNIDCCITVALEKVGSLPLPVKEIIKKLGHSMDQFDLSEQTKSLQSIRKECEIRLQNHTKNQDLRFRTYQTLALCTGAVIVIILL